MKIKAILIFVFFSYLSFGQSPQKFTYQSIIKNSSGYLLKNQDVGLRISVLSNSSNGIEVYSEEHFPTSNSNGLVTLIIGEGLTNDNFSEIQWGDGEFFLKVEVDPEGGNNYTMNQTSQLLSVPYALYAGNSGSKLNLLGQDFITLQDQTLTVNKVDLADDVDGVLPIGNGGTGSSTAPMVGVITAVDSPAARVVLGLGTAATENATAFATAAQGALADTALQDATAFATAAQGALADTALQDATAFATAAQGALADTALQDATAFATAAQGALADTALQDATAFATAAQGALADTAQQPPSEGAFVDGDKTKLDGISASANNYTLPDATSSALGGIKVGTNLSIDINGVLSSTNTTYNVGDGGLTENDFTDALKSKLDGISASANNYTLPDATSSALGGIKVGTNLSIDINGVLSSTNTTYNVGDGGLTENDFTDALKSKLDGISASANNYTLPDATSSALGGIKVGTNLSIDINGVLSSTNTTYNVGDGGLTENDFTDALKSKLDNLGTISTQDFDAVNIDGGTIDGTSTTQSLGDNSTKIATTSYVDNSLSTRDNLSEILANGNTTGGSDIIISSGDDMSFSDTSKIFLGSDNDSQLYHNGSHNYFTNSTGNFEITSTGSLILQDANSSKWMMTNQGGSVLLYHNGTSKFSTSSSGVSVTGNINSSGSTNPTITVSDNTNSHYLTLQGLDNASKIDYLSTLIFEYGSSNTEIARFNSSGLDISGLVNSVSIEVTNLKAKDGTSAGSIANSTGVVTLSNSVLTTTDINGGTVDGSTIATSDISVGSGKTLDVSSGTLTVANDQISGDKVEGGTIAATTITSLTSSNISIASKTITPSGNTGNQTIDATAGSVNFSSSDTTLTVTNNLVDANSVVILTRGTAVSANRNISVVPSSGQFIITLDASFGVETKVFFLVIN
jgi:hypothetical protein